MRIRVALTMTGLAGVAALVGQMQADGAGGGGIGPDVIVKQVNGSQTWGTVGGITGYSLGTTSCNIGDEDLLWDADTNGHPVIGQNIYRLLDGRFEQIGQSFLKHAFSTVNTGICGNCNNHLGQVLGVGCSDPYGASLNGDQDGFPCGEGVCSGGLGPRFEVNATTGAYLWPYSFAGDAGNAIYKRCQVHVADVEPVANAGALYYGEGHYVTADDAAAANHHNNASYRQLLRGAESGGGWFLNTTGGTFEQLPALYAWQANDPEVVIVQVEDDDDPLDDHDGRFNVGFLAGDNGDGTWHYEYAVHNMNSDRSAGSYSIPVPAGVTVSNVGFHDVDYHSGEPYQGTDWAVTVGTGTVTWETTAYEAGNDIANALRWGTLYNFRFDADTSPTQVTATIGLHKPGTPTSVSFAVTGPSDPANDPCPWDIDKDEQVGVTDLLALLGAWGTDPGGPPDFDGDGIVGATDLLKLLGQWGPCALYAACGTNPAGCFEVDGAPGCVHQTCCETVCAARPVCCGFAWDATCATLAAQLCGTCGDPGAGDCCAANGTPGCDDLSCCQSVCINDAFCCVGEWDDLCATQAQTECTCP